MQTFIGFLVLVAAVLSGILTKGKLMKFFNSKLGVECKICDRAE